MDTVGAFYGQKVMLKFEDDDQGNKVNMFKDKWRIVNQVAY